MVFLIEMVIWLLSEERGGGADEIAVDRDVK